ncbi:MAG: double-strand break repair protein AddB, partial [Pseudomonadota bacterium]
RQVTAALDRWNILPDDSAGTPLHLSPPGRLLRQAAGLFVQRLDAKALLALLKHPLTHSGPNRDTHQIGTLKLEALIRRKGLPYPDTSNLVELGKDLDQGWLAWVAKTFCGQHRQGAQPLSDWVAQHSVLAEKIAAGVEAAETHGLWKKAAGQKAESVLQALTQEADNGGMMSASDYAEMFYALLSAEEVRDRDAPHPGVMIWGTLEARVQGADLVILGGLNEGIWPEAPAQDPWLNRQMRLKAGLLLPERRIGLSAHDYQQAIAAPEVWLTRAIRSDEAETIPSRWLSRLTNLMGGLPDGQGQRALEGMRRRGAAWLGQAKALELASNRPPAPRPSPCPPVISRPNTLSVTEIKRLIRDPYAVYARHVLRVRPLNPLVQSPDAPVRGIIMHQVMEDFVRRLHKEPSALSKEALMCIANTVLATAAPWPAARAMWRARIERIAAWFIAGEQIRQAHASASVFEDDAKGKITLDDIGFTLVGKADRIDTTVDGRAIIYDYKTGNPPSEKEQKFFDKQLLLEAAMLEQGGFEALGPLSVAEAKFIGLGAQPKEVRAPLEVENTKVILADLRELIASYRAVDQGYTSRRIVQKEDDAEDYDHLARFGEWDGTSPTVRQHLK